jgi:hypothetical protein
MSFVISESGLSTIGNSVTTGHLTVCGKQFGPARADKSSSKRAMLYGGISGQRYQLIFTEVKTRKSYASMGITARF